MLLLLNTKTASEETESTGPAKTKPKNVMMTHWGRGWPQAVVGSIEPHRVVGKGRTENQSPSRVTIIPANSPTRAYFVKPSPVHSSSAIVFYGLWTEYPELGF